MKAEAVSCPVYKVQTKPVQTKANVWEGQAFNLNMHEPATNAND